MSNKGYSYKKRKAEIAGQAKLKGYDVDRNNELIHRKIWKMHNGPIPTGWVIHHIDSDRKNNNIANLIAMPEHVHIRIHEEMAAGQFVYTKKQLEPMVADYRVQYDHKIEDIAKVKKMVRKLNALTRDMYSNPKAAWIAKYHKEMENAENIVRWLEARDKLNEVEAA